MVSDSLCGSWNQHPKIKGDDSLGKRKEKKKVNSPKVNSPSSYVFCPFVQICRSVSAYRPRHPRTEWKALGDPSKGLDQGKEVNLAQSWEVRLWSEPTGNQWPF